MSEHRGLIIIGSGIQAIAHLTLEAKAHIETAEKVLYAVVDSVTAHYLSSLNASAEPLPCHQNYPSREAMYQAIVVRIMDELQKNVRVCVVFYGHPGVLAKPTRMVSREALRQGYKVNVLPGISADACLYADLGLDPGLRGCQNFEATNFLMYRLRFDSRVPLLLWQVALLGNKNFYEPDGSSQQRQVLCDILEEEYLADHEVVLYEASIYATWEARVQHIPLSQLPTARVCEATTLYIPPRGTLSADHEMLRRLGMRVNEKGVGV